MELMCQMDLGHQLTFSQRAGEHSTWVPRFQVPGRPRGKPLTSGIARGPDALCPPPSLSTENGLCRHGWSKEDHACQWASSTVREIDSLVYPMM